MDVRYPESRVLGKRQGPLVRAEGIPIRRLKRAVVFDGIGELVKHGEQHADAFQTCVHALPVEGNHGISGIADDDPRALEMVRTTLDADEGEVGIGLEGIDQGTRGN